MKNYIQEGKFLTFTAPAGGATSGVPVKIGALVVIPATTVAEGSDCEGATCGVYELSKKPTDTPAQFAAAYWDDTNKEVTTTASGNTRVGVFTEALAAGTASAPVRLDGVSV